MAFLVMTATSFRANMTRRKEKDKCKIKLILTSIKPRPKSNPYPCLLCIQYLYEAKINARRSASMTSDVGSVTPRLLL